MKTGSPWLPALTLRSVLASVFAMFGTAVAIHWTHVILVAHSPGEHALVIPGLWVFGLILGVVGLFFAVFRLRLLTRGELLCVLYAVLLSGPMMTQGFWHRIVSITATIPRTADFVKMDAFSEKLWPAGKNVLGELGLHAADGLTLEGNFRHEVTDHTLALNDEVLVLENERSGEVSSIRFSLPVRAGEAGVVMAGTPYLVSALIRPENLAGDSFYFIRVYADEAPQFDEPVRSRRVRADNIIHPQGFQREGVYAYEMPQDATRSVTVEFGLEGSGRLWLADPQLRSVMTLEQVFTGRQIVAREDFERLPEHLRHGLIVKPDRLLSWEGVRFLAGGYIPWEDWWRPIFAWGSLLALLLVGSFSVAVIMRRKWIDGERYSMPLTKVPMALIGDPEEPDHGPFSAIWRNRAMWIGFVVSFLWCSLKVLSFYNPSVPDPGIDVAIGSYFGPEWGNMWNISFTVFAVFVSLAIFIELNILISFIFGFFIFRALFWYGYVSGMDAMPGYPYAQEQQIGSYLTYAFLVLFFSRKYLVEVVKEAFSNDPPERGEVFSYRTALLIMVAVAAGSALWAHWVEISVGGMLLFMAFLLTVSFVAMKIRAECGVPYGYFTPNNAAMVIMLAGGISAFGPGLVLFTFMASFFATVTVLMLIPGAQLELIELGRRYSIRPRHLIGTAVLALLGGVLIGGWVFLSGSYSQGGDFVRYNWGYDSKSWYFSDFNRDLSRSSSEFFAGEVGGTEDADRGMDQSTLGYIWGAGGVAILTVLRQLFAGFWFHPIGFILGSTHMIGSGWLSLWGSILTAWVIRSIVVKIGGAETVRTKLLPFFVGVFLAAVTVTLIAAIHGAYLRSQGVELIFNNLL